MKFELLHPLRVRTVENGLNLQAGMPLPTAVEFAFEHIAAELKVLPRWMPFRFASEREWRPGQRAWSKLPIDARAGKPGSVADPTTWATWEQAVAYLEEHSMDENPWTVAHGLGMVVAEPYTVCDLDHHVAEGEPDEFGVSVLRRLNTYCEVSVSGRGLHVVGRATLAMSGRKNSALGLEVYCRRRFLTFTGVVVVGWAEIQHRQADFEGLVADFLPLSEGGQNSPHIHRRAVVCKSDASAEPRRCGASAQMRSDEQVLALIRKDCKANRLWNGNWAGYPSPSEADAALTVKLLFYSGGDQIQTDRLFRQSALFRPKWDRPCGETTVGQHTIGRETDWMDAVGIGSQGAATQKRGRRLSATSISATRLLAEKPGTKPAELARALGIKRPYAKKLIRRVKARGMSGEQIPAPSSSMAPLVPLRRRRRPPARPPAFDRFLKMTRSAGDYRPDRRGLERLFLRLLTYAVLRQFPLKERELKGWWRKMLEWRASASGNELRAKRCLRHSLREFLRLALSSIDSQAQKSAFSSFRLMIASYYRALGAYCPPLSSVLGAYVDLMNGSCLTEASELRMMERALRSLASQTHPPLRVVTLVENLG